MGIAGRAEQHPSAKTIRTGTARHCHLAASQHRKCAERSGLSDERANRVVKLGDEERLLQHRPRAKGLWQTG